LHVEKRVTEYMNQNSLRGAPHGSIPSKWSQVWFFLYSFVPFWFPDWYLLYFALLCFCFLFFSFFSFSLLLMQHISILSYFQIFRFSYFQNTSHLYSMSCFRTVFHRAAGCIKWRRYLFMGMSVWKRGGVYVVWGLRLEIGDWRWEMLDVRC
jgi:hypothetical protein